MDFLVEPAEPNDLDAIVDLLVAQLEDHGMGQERANLTRAVKGIFDDPSRGAILVGREARPSSLLLERRVLGIACLSFLWTLEHGGPAVWLDELYVIPEERSRGLGRALLLLALDRARARGAVAIDLEVDEDHARAERLYEREGFRRHQRARWYRRL